MKYMVKLEKIETNHNRLRTSEVVGITSIETPIQGQTFHMTAEALESKDGIGFRYVHTSKIKKVRNDKDSDGNKLLNTFEIATINSRYRITYLDEAKSLD